MKVPVTVVIPTYKRNKQLYDCIQSILIQVYKPNELIIVDNSENNSAQIIYETVKKETDFTIRYIGETVKNPSLARNVGIKNSINSVLAFIDDDCIADKNWLRAAYKAYKLNKHSVICGAGRPSDVGSIYALYEHYTTHIAFCTYNNFYSDNSVAYLDTKSFLIEKSLISKYNLIFDTRYKSIYEDIDFSLQLKQHDIRLLYERNMKVYHQPRSSLFHLIQREWNKGSDYLTLLDKWGYFYISNTIWNSLQNNKELQQNITSNKINRNKLSEDLKKSLLKDKSMFFIFKFNLILYILDTIRNLSYVLKLCLMRSSK